MVGGVILDTPMRRSLRCKHGLEMHILGKIVRHFDVKR